MANYGDFLVLDGSRIKQAIPDLPSIAEQRFSEIDSQGKNKVSSSQLKTAAESEAAALLLGSKLWAQRLNESIGGLKIDINDHGEDVDQRTFKETMLAYLTAVADALEAEPVVVSIIDGSTVRPLLEDEDDFAMLAENIFTELDVDDSGKLNRTEIKSALVQLSIEMGMPAPSVKSETEDLITKILKKYSSEGCQELGQAQFAKLFQDVLQDLADSLAAKPILVVRDVKVLNGSYLRKVLCQEELLEEMTQSIKQDLDINKDGKLSKTELRPIFESQGAQWGLPPYNEAAQEIYDKVFEAVDEDKSGDLSTAEFQVLVKALLENFAQQLEANPIFVDIETALQ